ncbi:hypothetical protein F5Y04DRAFT_275302 [Hypomontagnella monticulosa]|nr:hypothetical protein F5Y04DRAFT_275302 [Hypomontagnella monticulosa]
MRTSTVLAYIFGLAAIGMTNAAPSPSTNIEARWPNMTLDEAILVGCLEAFRLENGLPSTGPLAAQHYDAAMAQCSAVLGNDFEQAKQTYRIRMNYMKRFPTQTDVADSNRLGQGAHN